MYKSNTTSAVPSNFPWSDAARQLVDDFADEIWAMRFEIAHKTEEECRAILDRRLSPILEKFKRDNNVTELKL
jgi:hypothetical protein